MVFLPLVKTSQKFKDILNEKGFCAAEVNGESRDRAEVLEAFDRGDYNVLCNSMLLTEGWDCPSVDCVIVLRPTKVRSLYSQMVGRGTRLCEGKDHLLLLDFLWHTERHELCHPADLICEKKEVAQKMTENLEQAAGTLMDLEEAEKKASEDVIAEREEFLAKQLAEMKHRKKRKLVNPLQFDEHSGRGYWRDMFRLLAGKWLHRQTARRRSWKNGAFFQMRLIMQEKQVRFWIAFTEGRKRD